MWARYSLTSSAVTAAMVSYVYATREQFYPTVVYLVTSKLCVVTLGNQAIVLMLLFGRCAKALFLGSLREAEVELLYENARYAVTETCLALTIFREELTTRVFALFSALLFAKVFHWLANSRVEHVERAERVTLMGHARLVALISWLFALDGAALALCAVLCIRHGPSVLLLFGFEFAILAVVLLASTARYALHAIERRHFDGAWASKGSYVFFVEFAAEALRFVFYVVFFTIVFTYYGVPLHIVRELWVSYVSLRRRLTAYRRYRALTSNMDQRFETPTPQDLDARGRTCIICRDTMLDEGPDDNKKLRCGHCFHLSCLRLWLQQQQSCPTCRAEILVHAPPQPPPATSPTPANHVDNNNAANEQEQEQEQGAALGHLQNDDDDDDDAPGRDGEDDVVAGPPPVGGVVPPVQPSENDGPTPRTRDDDGGHHRAIDLRAASAARGGMPRVVFSRAMPAAAGPLPRSRPLPEGARIWRVIDPDGARVLQDRRRDAAMTRTIARGQHVLTLDDHGPSPDGAAFLRVGDGWLVNDPAVLAPFEDMAPLARPTPTEDQPPPTTPQAGPAPTTTTTSPPVAALSPVALAAERRAAAAAAAARQATEPAAPTATLESIHAQLATIQADLAALHRAVADNQRRDTNSDNASDVLTG